MQAQIDAATSSRVRDDLDFLHQSAHGLDEVGVPLRVVTADREAFKGVAELLDHAGISLGRAGVQGDGARHIGRLSEPRLDLQLFGLERHEAVLHGLRGGAIADGVDHPLDPARHLAKPPIERPALGRVLGRSLLPGPVVGADVGRDRVGLQQASLQTLEDAGLHQLAAHDAAVAAHAGAAFAVAGAGQVLGRVGGVGRPAVSALDQAGEQHLAALVAVLGQRLWPVRDEPRVGAVPEVLGDDAEMFNRGALPFLGRPEMVLALAGGEVLADFVAVPDLHPGIEFRSQDAVAALGIADDGAGVPVAATRRRDPVAVQGVGHLARRHVVVGVELEDAHDDFRLLGDDLHPAAGLGGVAVEASARGQTLLGVGPHAALGLHGEVAQEVLAREALHGHVHGLDFVVAEGGKPGAGAPQPVHHVRQVFEVAGDPVLVLHQEGVVRARLGRGDSGQQPRPVGHGGARHRVVLEGGDHVPSAPGRVLAADVDLVRGRSGVLPIVGEPGVDGDAQMRSRLIVGHALSRLALAAA